MTDIFLIVPLALLVTAVALLLLVLRKALQTDASVPGSPLDAFEKAQERTERLVREEVAKSRDEQSKAAREQRLELTEAFKTSGDSVVQRMIEVAATQKSQLDAFSSQLASFAKASGERLDGVRADTATGAKQVREEVVSTLRALSETVTQTMGELANAQKAQLEAFSAQLDSFAKASGERLDAPRAESAGGAKQLREEVVTTLSGISETINKTMSGLAFAQKTQLEAFANQLGSFTRASGEKLDGVRAESATAAKQFREEVVTTLKTISEMMAKTMKDLAVAEKVQLEAFSGQIAILTKTNSDKLDGIQTESTTGAKQLREEVITALKGITESTTKTMGELADLQRSQLEAMSAAIGKFSDSNEKKLEAVRVTVEGKLQSMQTDSAKQLEQMRQTVDEKLQGTLEKRLGEPFKQVSERLEQAHKGLGEMQTLATGVGDLKKLLTNVETNHVGDAIIFAPMLSFAEVVLKDPELKKKYGEAAEKYVDLAKRDLFEKWDKRGTWKEDRAWGCYIDWGMVSTKAHPDVWKKDTEPSIAESLNKNNHMGVCALRLFRITGEEKWRERAFKIFAYIKSRFQLVDEDGFSYYVWNYWEPFGPESADLAKKDTRLWMNVHGGRPYAAGEIGQMVEAYNTGVVFDKTDIERFLNTNLKVMWNGDKVHPHFSNSNWKLPMPLGPDGKPLPPEVNSPAGQLWTGLSQFSQEIRDLAGGRGRDAASERPPSFDRLYCAEKDAKVFDWPYYHSCKSLTVAAVLPSIVKKGNSAILLCKARIPQDPFEIALYSADGKKKVLVIHQGKIDGGLDGREDTFILQWDPASTKEKPLKGDYRIRWTGVDGYREFPVTVTE